MPGKTEQTQPQSAEHPAVAAPRLWTDARQAVFCDPSAVEVFHSVCHRHEIWREDPFDVATIHAEARSGFEELVRRTVAQADPVAGRILLILGESGAGKTHLMRVFRHHVHSSESGYCGYLQMTSATPDYGRYVLSNLIDSLDQPYFESAAETTGLTRLSSALVELPSAILRRERESLREDRFTDRELAKFVRHLADLIIEDERYADCDIHLMQALLYLQRAEPRIKSRVLSYLRCEPLAEHDRAILGGIVPRTDAERTVEGLGRLMWCLQRMSLVVCVDQLEDMAHLDRDAERFRRAMTTVCALAERVPSSVFVISCLEDLYPPLQQTLTRSYVDRIERDPEPIRLDSRRSMEEIVGMVGRRLRFLYESAGETFDPAEPTFPIPVEKLEPLTNTRARDVLDWCRDYRAAVVDGSLGEPESGSLLAEQAVRNKPATLGSPPDEVRLTQLWNDALADHCDPTTDDDDVLAELLGWVVAHCSEEVTTGHRFTTEVDGWTIAVKSGENAKPLRIGLCNKSPQGGALSRQVKALQKQSAGATVVLVRSTEFPEGPRTKIAQQIQEVLDTGGRRVVVEDSDWRAMHAMQAFREAHGGDAGFAEWLRVERPLTRLKSLRSILALDELVPIATVAPPLPQRRAA